MKYFNIKKIIFNILVLIIEKSISSDIYKIPFGIYNLKDLNDSIDIIDNFFYNTIYINLSIGTPQQIIPFALDINSQTFSAPYNLFDKNLSSSFEYALESEYHYQLEDVSIGFCSKDILNLNNTKQKINFILGIKYLNNNNKLGIIGLKIPKKIEYLVYPFFRSLKKVGYIKSYVWTLKFFDNISLIDTITFNKNKSNIIGEFIFGDEPHNYEIDKYKYNNTEYFKVNTLSYYGYFYWDIEFNSIYFMKKDKINENKFSRIIVQGIRKAKIIPEKGFMICPLEFFDSIIKNFFQEYFDQGICKQNKINNNYFYKYIECNYNTSFKVSSFPTISFDHLGFDSIFNLTYKDLFIVDRKNNKYIFLIFNKKDTSSWELGRIFLRKYQFIFNEDLKSIGYYKSTNVYNNIENNNNKVNKMKYAFLIIIIFIFSFLLFLLGMFCQKKFLNKDRKIRANELEENFSYESNFNIDKNKINKKNKSIIKEDDNEQKYYSI